MDPLYDSEDLFPQSPIAIRLESSSMGKSTSHPPPYLLSMSGELHSPDASNLNEIGYECAHPPPPSTTSASSSSSCGRSSLSSSSMHDIHQHHHHHLHTPQQQHQHHHLQQQQQQHHHHHLHLQQHHSQQPQQHSHHHLLQQQQQVSPDTLTMINSNASNEMLQIQSLSSSNPIDCSSFSFDYLDGKLEPSMISSVWTGDTCLPGLSGYELTSLDYGTGAMTSLLDAPDIPIPSASPATSSSGCSSCSSSQAQSPPTISDSCELLTPVQSAARHSAMMAAAAATSSSNKNGSNQSLRDPTTATALIPSGHSPYVAHPEHLPTKPPDQWDSQDVRDYLFALSFDLPTRNEMAHTFGSYCGAQLITFTRPQLMAIHCKLGDLLFEALQSLSSRDIGQLLSNRLTLVNGASDAGAYNSTCPSNSIIATDSTQTTYFGHLPSFSLLRNSNCFELDSHGQSPSSISESDRESTSSCMTAVNERQMNLQPPKLNSNRLSTSSSCSASSSSSSVSLSPHQLQRNSAVTSSKFPDSLPSLPETDGSFAAATGGAVTTKIASGRRGRPPKKDSKTRNRQGHKDKNNGKLWEFIRDLLLDPVTNPSFIRWERREDGMFKFVQSDKVAKLWGQRKQNPRMTYEKLSRAMRYYYKSQVLLPVFGRRLVYKFGPNATGWRPVPSAAF